MDNRNVLKMTKADLLADNGNERTYRSMSGSIIVMEYNEFGCEIIFKTLEGKRIGEFVFSELDNGCFKLIRMYSNEVKRSGIGREALKFFKAVAGNPPIIASPNDGIPRNDQSHLTGNAPIFVKKMKNEGLIEKDKEDFDCENDY